MPTKEKVASREKSRLVENGLKGAMSRIARLLSYHSFGAKNSLERQKPLLIKRVNIGYSWPSSSFSFPT